MRSSVFLLCAWVAFSQDTRYDLIGHIGAGADADIAVLRLDRGKFGYVDVKGGRIDGNQRLGCEMTLRGGKIVYDFNGRAGVPWRGSKIEYPAR